MSGPLCSQCGHVMKLINIVPPGGQAADPSDTSGTGPWFFAGANFACTNCEQSAHVRPDGSGTMTLVSIHPQARTAQDHHDYVDYWQAEKMMFLGMRLAAVYITQEVYDEKAEQIAEAAEKHKTEHPLPQSLWQRVRDKLGGANT